MPKQKQDKNSAINQFVIYNIRITTSQHPKMFLKETDGTSVLENAQKHFASLFAGKKLILKGKRKRNNIEENIDYPNDIISKHEDVYLLRINNRVDRTIVTDSGTTTNGITNYEERKVESNPYCYVIIDNRRNINQMAIQKNSAFGDPKRVLKILQENLQEQLSNSYPLDVTLSMKIRSSKIWEFCNSQCRDNGDAITRISFNFPNQKAVITHAIPKEYYEKGFLKEVNELIEKTQAIKMLISMDYSEANTELLEQHTQDFVNIIRVCKDRSYNLSISFRDYGEYRCDDLVKAMFPMDEALINSFRDNFMDVPFEERYGLIEWCNMVCEKSKIYDNALQVPGRRHRKNKK